MSRIARLSPMEHLILELLSEGGEMYGLELVSVSDGRLKRGTVYVTLGRMEEKGLVQSRLERPLTRGKVPQRRLYKPTSIGVRVLKAWRLLGRMLALEPIR